MALNKKTYEYNFPIELFDVGNKYSRNDIDQRLEKVRIDGWKGVTEFLNCFALVVTIEKANKPKNHKYKDFFRCPRRFGGSGARLSPVMRPPCQCTFLA